MVKLNQYGGRNRGGSIIQSESGQQLPTLLSNELFDDNRTITSTLNGLLGSVSSTATFLDGNSNITASITGLLGTVTATATNVVPQYNITTSLDGLLGVINSDATFTIPTYEVSGNISGLLGGVSGTLSTAQQFEISGNIVGILGGISASLQYAEPVIELVSIEDIRGNSGIRNDLKYHRKKVLAEDEEIVHVLNIFINGNKGLF